MYQRRASYFSYLLLLLSVLVFTNARAAEDGDPYAKLFKAQQAMAEKGDPLAEYYLGEMYESGLGTPVDIDQALIWYKRSAAKGNALAKKRIEAVENERTEAGKAKQRAAARAREVAAARQRQRAEAIAKAKQLTDAKAKAEAEAEAARLAKEEEDEAAAVVQPIRAPDDDPVKREARRRAILDQVRRIQQERTKQGDAFW